MKDVSKDRKEYRDLLARLTKEFQVYIQSKENPGEISGSGVTRIRTMIQKSLNDLTLKQRELLRVHFVDEPRPKRVSFGAWLLLSPARIRLGDAPRSADPPCVATFLLLLAPKKHREHLLGDLEEEYRTVILARFGLRRARVWFWWQVCISLAPLVGQQLRRIAGLAVIWKYIGR